MANIIDHINFIFDRICAHGGEVPPTRDRMRVAQGENIDAQIATFKSFNSGEKKLLLSNVKMSSFYGVDSYNSQGYRYFAITGTSLINVPSEWESELLCKVEVDAPLIIYLCKILELNVDPRRSFKELRDEFLFQQNDEGYLGHDVDEIINIFESFNVFRISQDSIFYNVDDYELGYYFSLCQDFGLVSLPMFEIKDVYLSIICDFNAKVPKENIFNSLTSTHWKHCFLELYRCVEWLYMLPRTLSLKEAIGYVDKASSLAHECVDKLSWRKKEEDSLGRLIKMAFKNENFYEQAYWMSIFKDSEFSAEKAANVVYKLRNQFVHQFNKENEIQLNDTMWRELITFTLLLIKILYLELNDEI